MFERLLQCVCVRMCGGGIGSVQLWRISQELNTRVTEEGRCVCMCFRVKKKGLFKKVLKVGDGRGA